MARLQSPSTTFSPTIPCYFLSHLHRVHARWVLVLSSFFRQGNERSERCDDLPKVTQLHEAQNYLASEPLVHQCLLQAGVKTVKMLWVWLWASPSRAPGTTA